MEKSENPAVGRRDFLRVAATGTAALVASAQAAQAQKADQAPASAAPASPQPQTVQVLTTDRPGSDFMVDIIKSLGFEYVCCNPGSSFRSLHESLVNYGQNKNPELITCCHEESAVAMAQGYYKIEGEPMLVLSHGTVGLQHAAMGIYDAFCDRVPVYIVVGNTLDATLRRPGAEWYHSVQDAAAMVRDYTKWDDTPISLGHFSESAVRAYKIAMTPPTMPVLIVADSGLQEEPIPAGANLHIPKKTMASPPQGDSGAIVETAKMLVDAENPVIVADRLARTPEGIKLLIELAETLQAAVVDQGGRMNFPSRHPLNQSERQRALIGGADVILALEVSDFWGNLHSIREQLARSTTTLIKPGVKLISITAADLHSKSNYQDFQRFQDVDLAIAGDAEATLPSLIEEIKRRITADKKRNFQERGIKLAAAQRQARERLLDEARYGWDASPLSHARIAAELWAQIKTKDWSLVSIGDYSLRPWTFLWNFEKPYHHIGASGGAGAGYGAPAAVGAALANRKYGRFSINFQNDGDLMYAPGVLWTAAHHRIPMLWVMNNNRAYHQETMHLQRMANLHNRGITTARIGTGIEDPNIDYAKLAQSMGWWAEGPIADSKELGPAIQRAIAAVERGEPALLDTVTQPR